MLTETHYARLYAALAGLPAAGSWPALARAVAAQASGLLGASGAALYWLDPALGQLAPAAVVSGRVASWSGLPGGKGLAARALSAGGPLIVADYASWDGRSAWYDPVPAEGPTLAAALAVPLAEQAGGHALGALVVFWAAPPSGAPWPGDWPAAGEVLSLLAAPAAALLARQRELDGARQRLSELELVSQVSARLRSARTAGEVLALLLDGVLAGLAVPAGSCWLYDPIGDELDRVLARGAHAELPQRLRPTLSVPGRVFKTGQPYASREYISDPYAPAELRARQLPGWGGAAVPIRLGGEVAGVLWVSTQLPQALDAGSVGTLAALAEAAGNAFERLPPGGGPGHRAPGASRQAAQRTIDTALMASLDLNQTLNIILDQVIGRLHVHAASVLLLDAQSQALEHAAARGFYGEGIQQTRVRVGEGLAGRCAQRRRAVSAAGLAEAGETPERLAILAGEGFVAYHAVPLLAKGRVKGVLEVFQRAPLPAAAEWLDYLDSLAAQAAIAIDNAQLFRDVQRSHAELALAYDRTLEGWSRALELRDLETEGHTQRVTELTLTLARALGMPAPDLVHMRRGALLHDIGKIGIPDSILLKRGPLTPDEAAIMRRHPEYAYRMLKPIAFLAPALDIPFCHHERWDGRGYPRGLRGEAIPLAARVFAVADVWDALHSDRPYRPAWPIERVREHMGRAAGSHFETRVVEVFLAQVAPEAGAAA